MASNFVLLAGKAIAEGLDLTSGDNEQFLKLNRHQCKYVAQKMSESREVLQVSESAIGSVVRCEAALKELYRVLTNALSLIKDCRFEQSFKKDDLSELSLSKDDNRESWLRAAITQRSYERSEDFAEICYDLQWCTSIVRISRLQSAATPRDAILEPEDCDGSLGALDLLDLQRAGNQDLDDLRSNLEPLKQGHVCDDSCELSQTDSSLAAHLLERLNSKLTPTTTEILTSSLWKVDAQHIREGEFLGGGAFGVVLETEWLGQKHAKKVFPDFCHSFFKDESDVVAGLNHPHLLRIVGSSVNGRGRTQYALLMELMQESLFRFLDRTQVPLSILAALDLMLQVARGLKYLHSRRIVHLNVKSANILVAPLTAAPELEYSEAWLNAKLAGFGLSKTKDSITSRQTLDQGTRKWMAPELFGIPEDEIDNGSMERPGPRAHPFKADVYSFAVVCSEILTKKYPFADVLLRDLLKHIRYGVRPELPDGCPRRLASLIERCWDFEPLSRPDFPEICRELTYIKGLLLIGDKTKVEEVGILRFPTGPIKVQGPWGGDGIAFCDGVSAGITGFKIKTGNGVILSLEVECDICSQSFLSTHGDIFSGGTSEQIVLKYPEEYLQQIQGSYDETPWKYSTGYPIIGITSITFKSNFRAFGPYGKLGTVTFKSEIGKIVGFWGKGNRCINSIGVFTVNPT
ncbi:hypothetical protein BDL97_10G049300 [Sphagnum fallax]|nr:hypothetical protein BDL97_10G049300 [Sphagnum fallax]